jgi:heme/copper-type cytochrome/quinol oxidase subunit 2
MHPFSSTWFWVMLVALVLIIIFFVYFDTGQSEETGEVITPSWAWIVLIVGITIFFVAFIIYYMVIYKFETIESHLKNVSNKLQIYHIPPEEITGYTDTKNAIWETKMVPIERKMQVRQECGTIKEEKELIMAKAYTRVYLTDCETIPKDIVSESLEIVDKTILPDLTFIEKDLEIETQAIPNFLDL